ncbi:YciI family protein [Paenibacillus chitinolyticus]|uniref:YciI family protein n=1 Tax=Paenibacillus chitinolyticus TaxID=79263 RepID=UPI003D035F66
MRFMLILKATGYSEAGVKPGQAHSEAMAAYRKSLAEAGALLAAEELEPSSAGIRIQYSPGVVQPVFEAGPFVTGHGLLAGYTLIEVNSEEEAVNWALRMPVPQELGTFGIEVRKLEEQADYARNPMNRALEADLEDQLELLKTYLKETKI